MAPMLFHVLLSYAGENATDGDLSGYTTEDFLEIYEANHVHLNRAEVSAIVKALHDLDFFDGDKIRSWKKFNPHLANQESLLNAKRRAGKIRQRKWAQEARESIKQTAQNPSPNPAKDGEENRSVANKQTGQLWLIEKALESAPRGSPARKELLAKKKALLSKATHVNLSEPAPSPAPPARTATARKSSPGDFERAQLSAAKQLIADGSPESLAVLNEGMVLALVNAGQVLPAEVHQRFRKLLEQHEKKAGNPIPG